MILIIIELDAKVGDRQTERFKKTDKNAQNVHSPCHSRGRWPHSQFPLLPWCRIGQDYYTSLANSFIREVSCSRIALICGLAGISSWHQGTDVDPAPHPDPKPNPKRTRNGRETRLRRFASIYLARQLKEDSKRGPRFRYAHRTHAWPPRFRAKRLPSPIID